MTSKYYARFDAHLKAVEGVNQQTIIGGTLTLFTTIIVLVLLYTEISGFFHIDVVSRMVADTTASVEAVRLTYDLEFYKIPCQQIDFMQEVTKGSVHFAEYSSQTADLTKIPLSTEESPDGCRLKGSIVTDKIGGNFRFSISKPEHMQKDDRPVPALQGMTELYGNQTHKINSVVFEATTGKSAYDKIPDLAHPLTDQTVLINSDVGMYQYTIQVVPTQYKTLYGELSFLNQYFVTEKETLLVDVASHPPVLNGQVLRDFQGLIFTYDFHPVMLYMEERREHLVDFFSNLFGIVGGVITFLTIFEGMIHQSSKVLIGKED